MADLAVLHQALGNRERSQTHRADAIDALLQIDARDANSRSIIQQRAALLIQQLYREALDHRDAGGMERALHRMEGLAPQADGPAGFAVKSFLEETHQQALVLISLYKAVDQRNEGHDAEAERLFDEALGAARRTDSANKFLEAVVQAQRRRFPEAIQAFEEYQEEGAALGGLGGSLLKLMQSVSGSQARELQIARRRSLEQSFSFLVRAKAYERAALNLQELEELAGTEWWANDEHPWRSLSDIAEMHEGLGVADASLAHYQKALLVYEQAIESLEQRRSLLTRDELKTALAADFGAQYLYFQAVRVAIKLAQTASDPEQRLGMQRRAFALSEQGRARALLDLMAGNLRRPAEAGVEATAWGRWRELTASVQLWRGMLTRARSGAESDERVKALGQKIETCERQIHELQKTINCNQPQLAKLLSSAAQVASLDEIVARLAPSTAMLQYMTLGEELLVWAVTRQGMNDHGVIGLRAPMLAREVREFHQSCAVGVPLEVIRQTAAKLSADLLDPLAPAIEQHEHLIVTPYGDLNLLPFSALLWQDDWLGKQRTLSYLPSASMLVLLPQSPSQAAQTTLAVGNPQHMSHRPPFGAEELLSPLAHAETEARAVAKLYGTQPLIGPEATVEEIRPRLSTHRQLLFATHGVLYEEAPLLSGIALANGYILTVQELMGLKLDADLITVSACKSALGTRTRGEEILGLTRGLLTAGARAVVVSLWPVLDLSTAVLIVQFHQHLKDGADPATALAQAQRWLSGLTNTALDQEKAKLRDLGIDEMEPVGFSHPQHWTPFIVIGA
jgi:CHAT domain-containing protein